MLHNSKELHSEVTIEILQNKLLFQYFCYAHGINTPKFLGFLVNGCCYDSTGVSGQAKMVINGHEKSPRMVRK